jgi:hypothetical protein
MTVKELMECLSKMPPDASVCVRDRESGDEGVGYDEVIPVRRVLPPNSPENWWDKSVVVILG